MIRPVLAASVLAASLFAAVPASAAPARVERLVVSIEATVPGARSLPVGTERVTGGPVRAVPSRRRIGHWNQACVAVTRRTDQCETTVVLPKGRIMLSGTWRRPDGPGHMAVVGGTGGYLGVRGDVRLQQVPGPDHDVFRLLRGR